MRYVGRTMTALDDIKELDRENSAFNRKLLGALLEEHQERMEEKIAALRDTLLDAPGQIIALAERPNRHALSVKTCMAHLARDIET